MRKTLLLMASLFMGVLSATAEEIDIVDLKLDIDTMVGQEISVVGNVMMMGDMAMISDPNNDFDTSPVLLEVKNLPREDRKFLLTQCEMECRVKVHGKVGMVFFQAGVVATSLERP